MFNALKTAVIATTLVLGLASCAQDVEFEARSLGVRADIKPPPAVPELDRDFAPSIDTAPAFAPLPQCLGKLSHPTYRRDLPPQPDQSVEEQLAGCEVENGVLYRYSAPNEPGIRFAPGPDLHGIGI